MDKSAFYNTKAWQDCREAYKKKRGGLCELCMAQGLFNAGEIVHHKIHITDSNVNNPEITLHESNLLLVCREHHAQIHRKTKRRYIVDAEGHVTAIEN